MSDRYGPIGLALITSQGIRDSRAKEKHPEAVPWVGLVVSITDPIGSADLRGTLILSGVSITHSLRKPSLGLGTTPQLHMSWLAVILEPCRLRTEMGRDPTHLIRLSLLSRDIQR